MKKLFLFVSVFSLSFLMRAQSIVSISPNNASVGQQLKVTITGNNQIFNSASPLANLSFYNQYNNFLTINGEPKVINGGNQLEVSLTVPNNAVVGDYTVKFINSKITNGFKVNGVYDVSISPKTGVVGQTLGVTITGTNQEFSQASGINSVSFVNQFNNFLTVNGAPKIINSGNELEVSLTIPNDAVVGDYTVNVTNSKGENKTVSNGFTVISNHNLSVSPNNGIVGQQLTVTITGTNQMFHQASTINNVSFYDQFSNFLTVVSTKVVGVLEDQLEVVLSISDQASLGDYTVKVFNSKGLNETLSNGFEVISANDSAFSQLKMYPNPVDDLLRIKNNSVIESIEISSISGIRILDKKVNSLQTEVSFSNLANGMYLVRIVVNGSEKTLKVIKK